MANEAAQTSVAEANRLLRWMLNQRGTLQACFVLVWGFASAMRNLLLLGLGVGLAVGVISYLAGPVFASTINGLAGFAASVLVSLGHQVWRESTGTEPPNT